MIRLNSVNIKLGSVISKIVNKGGCAMSVSFIEVVLLVGIIYLLLTVSKMQERLKGMKNSLEQMRKQMDLPEDPINDDLRQLIKEGKDIKAVKKAREALGLSLLEGKQYVDALKDENS